MTNRRYLKDATQRQHASAESSWTQNGRFLSRADYEGWLKAIWAAHCQLGHPAALTCGGQTGCVTEQARIDALRDDLGLSDAANPNASPCSTSWAYGVQYALNGSAIGAATLLKAGAVPLSWPTQYLQTMRTYATSGQLGQFFAQLDHAVLSLPVAARGASAVFGAITRAPNANSNTQASTAARQ